MKTIVVLLMLLFISFPLKASIIQYEGSGGIVSVSHEGVSVDKAQLLSFTFSFDDSASNISTDVGRGEYITGNLQATVGGFDFFGTGIATVITNDILSTSTKNWLLTSDIVTNTGLTGWFQVFLGGGPAEEGISVIPLSFSDYSSPWFFTAFGAGDDFTNFSGTLSNMSMVSEPSILVLLTLGLAGFVFITRRD